MFSVLDIFGKNTERSHRLTEARKIGSVRTSQRSLKIKKKPKTYYAQPLEKSFRNAPLVRSNVSLQCDSRHSVVKYTEMKEATADTLRFVVASVHDGIARKAEGIDHFSAFRKDNVNTRLSWVGWVVKLLYVQHLIANFFPTTLLSNFVNRLGLSTYQNTKQFVSQLKIHNSISSMFLFAYGMLLDFDKAFQRLVTSFPLGALGLEEPRCTETIIEEVDQDSPDGNNICIDPKAGIEFSEKDSTGLGRMVNKVESGSPLSGLGKWGRCSGSLKSVAPDNYALVLTAGHCVSKDGANSYQHKLPHYIQRHFHTYSGHVLAVRQILYSSFNSTDIAIVQLFVTGDELNSKGISSYNITSDYNINGKICYAISTGQDTENFYQENQIKEIQGDYTMSSSDNITNTFRHVIQLEGNQFTYGFSGSGCFLFERNFGVSVPSLVSVLTASDGIAQDMRAISSCFEATGEFNIEREDCSLPIPKALFDNVRECIVSCFRLGELYGVSLGNFNIPGEECKPLQHDFDQRQAFCEKKLPEECKSNSCLLMINPLDYYR